VIVIGEQLGVPDEHFPLIRKWSEAAALQLSGQADTQQQVEIAHVILEFQNYFAKKLDERRTDRRDDIISDVVHARLEGERPLDTAECLSILQQLMVAGNQTTTHAIGEGMLLLIQNPEQLEKVRRHPELVDDLVEKVADFDMVGVSFLSSMFDVAVQATRAIQMATPDKTIVWGGFHPSTMPQQALEFVEELLRKSEIMRPRSD